MSYRMSQAELASNTLEPQQYVAADSDQDMFQGGLEEESLQQLPPEELSQNTPDPDTADLTMGQMEGLSQPPVQASAEQGFVTTPIHNHDWQIQDPSQQPLSNDTHRHTPWSHGQNGQPTSPSLPYNLSATPIYDHDWPTQTPTQQVPMNASSVFSQYMGWGDGQGPTSPSLPLARDEFSATPSYDRDWPSQDSSQQLPSTQHTGWSSGQRFSVTSPSLPLRDRSPTYLTPQHDNDTWMSRSTPQQPLNNEPDSSMTEDNEHPWGAQDLSRRYLSNTDASYDMARARMSNFGTQGSVQPSPSFNSSTGSNDGQSQTASSRKKPRIITHAAYRQMMHERQLLRASQDPTDILHHSGPGTGPGMTGSNTRDSSSQVASPNMLSDHTWPNSFPTNNTWSQPQQDHHPRPEYGYANYTQRPAPTEGYEYTNPYMAPREPFQSLSGTLSNTLLNQSVSVPEVQRQCAQVSEGYRRRQEEYVRSEQRNYQEEEQTTMYRRREGEYVQSEQRTFQEEEQQAMYRRWEADEDMSQLRDFQDRERATYYDHEQRLVHHLHQDHYGGELPRPSFSQQQMQEYQPRGRPLPQEYYPHPDPLSPAQAYHPNYHGPSSSSPAFPPQPQRQQPRQSSRRQPRQPRQQPKKAPRPQQRQQPPLSPRIDEPLIVSPSNPPTIRPHKLVFSGQASGPCPHPCPSCSLRFPTYTALRMHSKFHDMQKPFVCNIVGCNCRFNDAQKLMQHLRGHLGDIRCVNRMREGPHTGEHGCGEYFMNFQALRGHRQRVHKEMSHTKVKAKAKKGFKEEKTGEDDDEDEDEDL
ncbi:hypothetical protein VTL71DRAFT_2677 [Oculimacula yallundae]|uniref:C2H2-type domain-containing protein n=1 Tax=Oculimacula yallundae TaxID=86028 RepID=A0ABR4CAX1_9HELO